MEAQLYFLKVFAIVFIFILKDSTGYLSACFSSRALLIATY